MIDIVSLFSEKEKVNIEAKPAANGGNNGDNDGNNGDNGNILEDPNWLLSSEFVVYETLKEQPTLTIANVAKITHLSERTVQRAIKSLKEKGYIKRVGSTRGKWIILI